MFFDIKLSVKPIAYETMYYIVSYSLPFLRFRYTITDPIFTIGKWICSSTKLFQVLRVYNNIGNKTKTDFTKLLCSIKQSWRFFLKTLICEQARYNWWQLMDVNFVNKCYYPWISKWKWLYTFIQWFNVIFSVLGDKFSFYE